MVFRSQFSFLAFACFILEYNNLVAVRPQFLADAFPVMPAPGTHRSTSSLVVSLKAISIPRRAFLTTGLVHTAVGITFIDSTQALDNDESVSGLIEALEDSKSKLLQVPDLLKASQWDAARSILKTPPVNTLWNMGDGKNPILKLAKVTDEVGLIELKDELGVTLQMCDQLTYDNVFIYYQPGNGKVKVKEPIDLAEKAISQLTEAIDMAKSTLN
jgi:hypothetical protein